MNRKRHGRRRFFNGDEPPTSEKRRAHGAVGSRGKRNKKRFIVALAGNPNAGKTSLFNAITGQRQHIGNYPGVTVEKKTGYVDAGDFEIEIVDLPGTYSLSAYSLEEMVARDFVVREQPDLIVDVLDSTNLERNLYLLLQFQEFGVPVVGVLNMMDEAQEKGLAIDSGLLSEILGIPFVETVGHRGKGVHKLLDLVMKVAKGEVVPTGRKVNYGRELEGQRTELTKLIESDEEFSQRYTLDWLVVKLLEGDADAEVKVRLEHAHAEEVLKSASEAREWIQRHFNEDSATVVAEQRYAYIHGAITETVKTAKALGRINITETVDRFVLNRYAGLFVFFGVMFLVYQFTFALGNPLSDLIDAGFSMLADFFTAVLPDGLLRGLIVDGIIGGVGGVLVFFPLVMLLFLSLSLLEDSGYMARAAFVMDRFFHLFGMHGRSFIPFMIATGCAVPAVMSARTLVNPRDRIITVLVTPMLMCGAKSPVIAMLAAAFFPKNSALVFWGVWAAGWLIAFLTALIFRKTLFKGEAAPFVMELPPYRWPTLRGVISHMWERGALYLRKAGTIILAASLVVWFLLTFPQHPADRAEMGESQVTSAETKVVEGSSSEIVVASEDPQQDRMLNSYAGQIGKAIEPILGLAGFDWKVGISLISGVAAKEVIISTMGIVYGVGEADPDAEATEEHPPLRERIASDPSYSQASALALMFFVLIYFPCIATLAVVKKELGSWKWPIFLVVYTVFVSYALAVIVYQGATLLGM